MVYYAEQVQFPASHELCSVVSNNVRTRRVNIYQLAPQGQLALPQATGTDVDEQAHFPVSHLLYSRVKEDVCR